MVLNFNAKTVEKNAKDNTDKPKTAKDEKNFMNKAKRAGVPLGVTDKVKKVNTLINITPNTTLKKEQHKVSLITLSDLENCRKQVHINANVVDKQNITTIQVMPLSIDSMLFLSVIFAIQVFINVIQPKPWY